MEERSGTILDGGRNARHLPFTLWHPQSPGRAPLVLYSHASYGHRRQSSFLATHLASHGYVVAAVDHTRNSTADFAARTARAAAGITLTPAETEAYVRQIIADRVPDLRFLLDSVLDGRAGEVSKRIDPQRIGVVGWSFGGWAVLSMLEADERPGAVVALAPAGASNPLPGIIPATLTFRWKRVVPLLILAAERDQFTRLDGIAELFARAPDPKRMFVLRDADHGHFADDIDAPGLCPPDKAHLFNRALALAHFDAALKSEPAAMHFLSEKPVEALRAIGVQAVEVDRP